MKRECPICGCMFENVRGAKFCVDCRAEGKRICTQCGRVFVTPTPVSMCKDCNNKRKRMTEAARKERKRKTPKKESLDEKVASARVAGMSYGQYSAMRRGLLRV